MALFFFSFKSQCNFTPTPHTFLFCRQRVRCNVDVPDAWQVAKLRCQSRCTCATVRSGPWSCRRQSYMVAPTLLGISLYKIIHKPIHGQKLTRGAVFFFGGNPGVILLLPLPTHPPLVDDVFDGMLMCTMHSK